MESFALYLLKSVIWLTVFATVYFLLLRNERFFQLNRIFLVTGLMASLLFPLITFRYVIVLPALTANVSAELPVINGIELAQQESLSWAMLLTGLFTAGVLFFIVRLIVQSFKLIRIIRTSAQERLGNIRVIKTDAYAASFTFFSYVFVNPSTPDTEKREIVTHEAEHIRQHHWIDLVLAELICIVQWFNPLSWLYSHFIRQNHEYLADQMALRRTGNPAVYKAVLLNQLLGSEVIRLGHLFSYSLNKKRFTMMKNTSIPTIKKLKLLLVLPIIALVFYAFARPEYQYATAAPSLVMAETESYSPIITGEETTDENPTIASENKTSTRSSGQMESSANQLSALIAESPNNGDVKGIVVTEDGKPLPGTSVIVVGTTTGAVADEKGHFSLSDIEKNRDISFSFVGYKTVKVPASLGTDMKIVMVQDSKELIDGGIHVVGYGQLKETSSEEIIIGQGFKFKSTDKGKKPLFILDGKEISNEEMDKIDPKTIESITVLKDASATAKYGEKAANGVVEIYLKKKQDPEIQPISKDQEKPVFFVVEEMPDFPGGEEALLEFLATNVKYPAIAQENGIQGKVFVVFIIDENGKVIEPKIARGVDPILDQEAIRVVTAMPAWKPGKQRGKNVRVSYTVPINFVLAEKEKAPDETPEVIQLN